MAEGAPRGEFVAQSVQSGVLANADSETRVVFSHLIQTPNAVWTRVYFSELALDGSSTLRLTAQMDGEVQVLDADAARMWGNSSAYFNGDRVLVELIAAPNTRINRVAIDRIAVEFSGTSAGSGGIATLCGICGADDRVPSNVNWSARLMPTGCTASIFSTCSCLVSAGHCVSAGMVVQFNVPNSLSNCGLVNPPVADQFPITSYQYMYVDIGSDWSVLKSGTNSLGQLPYERYGAMQPIAAAAPAAGDIVGLWGYGVDTECVNSQRQQYSSGNVSVISPTFFQFYADLTTGNSGTGIIRNGQLIGVATNCMDGCPNVATSINVTAFANARASLCPCPGSGAAAPCPADLTGDRRVNMDDLVTVIGHWGACPSPPSACVGDVVTSGSGSVNVDDLVAVLTAWGNCP